MKNLAWFKNGRFRVTQARHPSLWNSGFIVWFDAVAAGLLTCAGSAALRLQLQRTKTQHRQRMRVRLICQELAGTFANVPSHTAAHERAVIEEELQQFQLLVAALPAQREAVAPPGAYLNTDQSVTKV